MKLKFCAVPLALAALAVVATAAKKETDPTILTVNGKNVPLSEFEYLYNKNNTQQTQPQTVDEYLQLFINYKLKVADAEAHGIDTTKAFIEELDGHRRELAKPYMRDTTVEAELVNNVLDRMDHIMDVHHIMVKKGNTPAERRASWNKLDSIRKEIVAGRADFAEMADKYSVDPQAKRNHGHMGKVIPNVYPYQFEDVAYSTPVGSISEVMETPFGYHIIKVEAQLPNPGKVKASHILKFTRGKSPADTLIAKAQIDSLYNLLKEAPASVFASVARMESEDRGTAMKGGELPWFGPGRMVPEFEKVAFELKDGEVSAPFRTAYGYHIIRKTAHQDTVNRAEERANVLNAIRHDDRNLLPEKKKLEEYKTIYKAKLDKKGLDKVKKSLKGVAAVDSASFEGLKALGNVTVASVGGQKIAADEVIKDMSARADLDGAQYYEEFVAATEKTLDKVTADVAIERLAEMNADYRNLVKEYRDGILLFEVSNRNVWDRAAKDTEGLEKFFNDNRAKYTWSKPHYKGYVIFGTTDSIASAAQEWLQKNPVPGDELVAKMREQFGRNVKVERVLAEKGENNIIDNIAFEGPMPDMSKSKWAFYFDYLGKVIDQPEEARDVKGAASGDYQQLLEKQWIEELKAKYPVKVNDAVLKQVK